MVPRVLADIYHSLGTQLPEALLAVLPADFFSDESVTRDDVSSASSPPLSTHSLVSDGRELQDLRGRAAGPRRRGDAASSFRCLLIKLRYGILNVQTFVFLAFRGGMLTRHRSMTESSQNLRQIEIPKKSTRAVRVQSCKVFQDVSAGFSAADILVRTPD